MEPSFVGIHQVLREIWPFEHEFQFRNFGQFNFWGYQICQQTFHKISFAFPTKLEMGSSKQLSKNKNKPIIVSFDRVYDQLCDSSNATTSVLLALTI